MLTANDVFLSPRVVDRAAFEELSGSLRAEIEHAAKRARTLASAVASAEATAKRLVAASSALSAAEARANDAAALYATTAGIAERSIHAETRAEQLVRDRLGAAEKAVAEFEARIDRAVAKLTSMDPRTLIPLMELCNRAEALIGFAQDRAPGGLPDVIATAQRAGAEACAAARELEHVRAHADSARALLADSIVAAAELAGPRRDALGPL